MLYTLHVFLLLNAICLPHVQFKKRYIASFRHFITWRIPSETPGAGGSKVLLPVSKA